MTIDRRNRLAGRQSRQLSSRLPARLVRRAAGRAGERGITTAEYAVGTAAGAGLAGVLFKLLTSGFGEKMLTMLFDYVLKLLGIG